MKLHKISKVSIRVCSAEQKIAYNYALAHCDFLKRVFDKSTTAEKVAELMKIFRWGYSYKQGKYNEDAIEKALMNGIEAYLQKPFIATDYEQIGQAFTI